MPLRIIGAGLGRTGTMSLKVALEQLLGEPCYHMVEVFSRQDHIPLWHQAALGQMPDWRTMFAGYGAVVDWPAASFWPELAAAFPEAIILLSVREVESWWQSASQTIFPRAAQMVGTDWLAMLDALMAARFTPRLTDREACHRAYLEHYAQVRAAAPRERLVEWQASDGWGPLCAALGLPTPNEPFPRTNTRDEFLTMLAPQSDEAS